MHCLASGCTTYVPAWPGMYAAEVLEWQCGQDLLQCTGLHVEGMDSSDGDVAALERRWLKPIYTAAPQLVLRYAQRLSHCCAQDQINDITEKSASPMTGKHEAGCPAHEVTLKY